MYETHPGRSPALLLPSLVFSLGKICKNLWSLHQRSDCPCLSLCSSSSTSSPQPSRALRLLLCCTRTSYPGLSNGSPSDFSSPAFFFSVSSHFAPRLLFSAFLPCCLPWHRLPLPPPPPHTPPTPLSLLSASPPASGFPSHTCTHTSALPALSSTFSFSACHCTQTFPAVTPSCIGPRHCSLLIFCFLKRCRPRS